MCLTAVQIKLVGPLELSGRLFTVIGFNGDFKGLCTPVQNFNSVNIHKETVTVLFYGIVKSNGTSPIVTGSLTLNNSGVL